MINNVIQIKNPQIKLFLILQEVHLKNKFLSKTRRFGSKNMEN
jgi:hypothetical protein